MTIAVPHSPFFCSTVRHYGLVIGTGVLNWMDLLCQYIEPYIPTISYRHNPRSVAFNFVSDLNTKVKWNCHTVLSWAVFYIYRELGKIQCWNQNTINQHDLATSQTILQLTLTQFTVSCFLPFIYLVIGNKNVIHILMMLHWRTAMLHWRTAFNGRNFINYRLLNIHWIEHSTHQSLESILKLTYIHFNTLKNVPQWFPYIRIYKMYM